MGHMTPGKGLVVHIESCPNINEFRRRASREIIPARWTVKTEGEFQTALRLNVSRRKGILAQIASEISDAEAGLEAINTEERNAEISTIDVALTVKNSIDAKFLTIYTLQVHAEYKISYKKG